MPIRPITIDAKGRPLGRLATRIAYVLRGKNDPSYQPHRIVARDVVVRNCSLVAIPPKKMAQKVFKRTSGFPGALKERSLRDAFAADPAAVLRRAVRGMLPANKQRKQLLLHLTIHN